MPVLIETDPPPESFAQLITPWAFAVSFPLLVKPVQSRLVILMPPPIWIPPLKVEVAVLVDVIARIVEVA